MNSNASVPSVSRQQVRSVLAVVALAALAALGLSPALAQGQGARAGRLDVNLDLLTFRASAPTPYAPDCSGTPDTGTLYANAEVEP